MTKPDIDTIKARRDWHEGRDLSPFEIRLDIEHLGNHYDEDVTALIRYVEELEEALAERFAQTPAGRAILEAVFGPAGGQSGGGVCPS